MSLDGEDVVHVWQKVLDYTTSIASQEQVASRRPSETPDTCITGLQDRLKVERRSIPQRKLSRRGAREETAS